MVDEYISIARPRALKREEAIELATDLLVKNPEGMGNGDVFFASNLSWLTDYSLDLDPTSDDLSYFITAGENFYSQATQEQKDTKTFAECARMLAVAYSHMHEDRAKIVYYQECASRCPEVQAKLNRYLGDALSSFDNLIKENTLFPELQSVAEAGLAGAKPGGERAARWTILVALSRLHSGDKSAAQLYYQTAEKYYQSLAAAEAAKQDTGFFRLEKELKRSKGASFLQKLGDTCFFRRPGQS